MIYSLLQGGLGNMLFQTAAIETVAYQNGDKVSYFNIDHHLEQLESTLYGGRASNAKEYLDIFESFTWVSDGEYIFTKNVQTGPIKRLYARLHFEQELIYLDKCAYLGYYQSEKYFPNRQFILDLFEPSNFVKKQLKKYDKFLEGKVASIHIRRGDYLVHSDIYFSSDLSYYEKAMDIIDADKYLVFSDDIEWCKENFIGDKFIFINDKDYVEMFLMSKCKDNIICGSSFSWWGSWLNKNPEKRIIAPKKWFKNNTYEGDIIPTNYIKI